MHAQYPAFAVPVARVLLVTAAWAIDVSTRGNEVSRNVVVADEGVPGTVVRGRRCPILVVHDQGRVFAMAVSGVLRPDDVPDARRGGAPR